MTNKPKPPSHKDGSKTRRQSLAKVRLQERAAAAARTDELPTLPPEIMDRFGQGDLFCVGDDLPRVVGVLAARLQLRKWRAALDRCGCTWDKVILAKMRSQTFAKLYELVDTMVRAGNVAQIEDVLTETASGDRAAREGFLPPDTKSASLYLAASDARYRAGNQANATSVTINLSM